MSDSRRREAQHRFWFNEYELAALADVCLVLGKSLGDYTRAQLTDFLSLIYTAPHSERADPDRALARLRLGGRVHSTFLRYEFERHADKPGFPSQVREIVESDGGLLAILRAVVCVATRRR